MAHTDDIKALEEQLKQLEERYKEVKALVYDDGLPKVVKTESSVKLLEKRIEQLNEEINKENIKKIVVYLQCDYL